MTNQQFTLNGTKYQVEWVNDLADAPFMAADLERNGKEPRIYHAAKVLKNGNLSKTVGGMFYRFKESENMIKAL